MGEMELSDDFDFEVDDEVVAPAADVGDEEGLREPILPGNNGGLEHGKSVGEVQGEMEGKGDEDAQVEGLESVMLKMQAIKDMGADMPEAERKRFAARAVRDAMKNL